MMILRKILCSSICGLALVWYSSTSRYESVMLLGSICPSLLHQSFICFCKNFTPPSHLLSICGYPKCTVDCKMCFSTAEGSCHGCADVVSAPTLLHGVRLIVPPSHQLLCTSRLPLVVLVQCPFRGELLACCTRQLVRCKKKMSAALDVMWAVRVV